MKSECGDFALSSQVATIDDVDNGVRDEYLYTFFTDFAAENNVEHVFTVERIWKIIEYGF